jgi:hypothetical protein
LVLTTSFKNEISASGPLPLRPHTVNVGYKTELIFPLTKTILRKPVPRSCKKSFVSDSDYFGKKGRDGLRAKDFSLFEGDGLWIPVMPDSPSSRNPAKGVATAQNNHVANKTAFCMETVRPAGRRRRVSRLDKQVQEWYFPFTHPVVPS